MKKTLFLILAAGFLFAGTAAMADTITAHVSDGRCKATHTDHSEKSIACVKQCVGGGQDTVLVDSEGEVHVVANADALTDHLGHEIKVAVTKGEDGKVTVDADSIEHVAP